MICDTVVGGSRHYFGISIRSEPLIHHGDVSPEIAQVLLAVKQRIVAAKIPSSKLDHCIHVVV